MRSRCLYERSCRKTSVTWRSTSIPMAISAMRVSGSYDVETLEHLEITAPDTYVRVIIRHKAMHKSDNKIFTATAPRNILQRAMPDLTH